MSVGLRSAKAAIHMMRADLDRWPRPLRWLCPGLGIKRWYALVFAGLALLGLGAVLLFNLYAIELAIWAGGAMTAAVRGVVGIGLGLVAVIFGVRGIVRAVARTFLPAEEDRLVDIMLSRRGGASGLRFVVIGGGTGLSSLLRGLKKHSSNITAIATVSDDGGSSGRLREDLGILPPGDLRNCLVALADSEPMMTRLFQYRFESGSQDLGGHSFGNLLIAALTDITGDFEEAVRASSQILAIRGRVLPPTTQAITLCAELVGGGFTRGETSIVAIDKPIAQVYLDPPAPAALPEAVTAIEEADVILIGPGSLFTSIIPNLLVPDITQAIAQSKAVRILVCNVMTQPGETDGFSVSDHVRTINTHVAEPVFDYVLLNTQEPDPATLVRYHQEGAELITYDQREIAQLGFIPIGRELISQDNWARHDPDKLAQAVVGLAVQHSKGLL